MDDSYQLRRGSLSGLNRLLSQHGVCFESILRDVGLPAGALDAADEMISVETLVTLLNRVAMEPELATIGLQLAESQGLEMLGILGRLLATRENLEQAFYAVQRYMALHNRAEHWRMQLHGNTLLIQRFEHCYTGLDARQYHELAMGNCFRLTQLLGGADIRPLRVEFAHRPLHALKIYRQFFGADVVFDQEQNQLLLDRRLLLRPLQVSAQLTAATNRYLQQFLHDCQDNLRHQVATLIQQTMGLQQHSLPEIAQLMGIQPRTLQRRLEKDGIIFRQLVSQVRNDIACWHLQISDMDITLLSATLGYSDVSAFSRAFQQWQGCSPRQWRQQANKKFGNRNGCKKQNQC